MPSAPRVTVRRSGTRGSSGGPTSAWAEARDRGGMLEGVAGEPKWAEIVTAHRGARANSEELVRFRFAKRLSMHGPADSPPQARPPSIDAGAAGCELVLHALQQLGKAVLLDDAVEAHPVVVHHARAVGHDVHDARALHPHDVVDVHRLFSLFRLVAGDRAHDLPGLAVHHARVLDREAKDLAQVLAVRVAHAPPQ